MSDFTSLRHRFTFAEVNPCVAVELRVAGTETRANIAILYWHKAITPSFVCVGPVFDSRDGEYREFVTTAEGLTADYGETLFAEKQSEVEARLLELIGDGTLEINLRNIGGVSRERTDALEDTRITILSAVAYIMDLFDFFVEPAKDVGLDRGETLYHFGPAHDVLAKKIRKLFADIVEYEETSLGSRRAEWVPHLRRFSRGMNYGSGGKCGTKTIPLTEREVASPYDISLSTWREYWALERGGDLGLNFIAPGVPQIVSTALIKGAVAAYYDNPSMHIRLGRGTAAKETAKSLRMVRDMAATESRDRRKTDPRGAEMFDRLDVKVYDALDFSASYIAPTDYALLIAQEFEGYTMYDLMTSRIPALVTITGDAKKGKESFLYLSDPGLFDKIIFDWVWTLHAAHVRGGFLQGDVHANNITARIHVPGIQQKAVKDDGPVCLYVDDRPEGCPPHETVGYAIPHPSAGGYLLDFSRAILGDVALDDYDSEFFTSRGEAFRADQVPRVYAALQKWAPTTAEREGKRLQDSVRLFPEAAFRALTAGDFVALGETMRGLADHAEGRASKGGWDPLVNTGHLRKRGGELASAGRKALNRSLAMLMGNAGGKTYRDIRPAGSDVIAEVFAEWKVPDGGAGGAGGHGSGWDPAALEKRSVGGMWRMGREMKFSGKRKDQFPPWAKAEEFIPHLGSLKITDILVRGPMPPNAFSGTMPEVEAIADAARMELDRPPLARSDEWLRSSGL
jgi:hypothetical protein